MTDTSKDAVDRLVLAMIRSGNTTAANMLNALAVERDAANARADAARDAALVEAADTLEAQALDADAQAKRFRGGSDTWADRTARSRALRNSASIILALRDKPAPAVTVREWQPIETAPKDALIDIWLAEGKRWCACYHDIITDEWRTSRPSGHLISIKARFVTHWMPLPEPPQSKFTPLEAIAGGDDE